LLPETVPAPGVVVLPAGVTNWPMSRLRAVMTPSKGRLDALEGLQTLRGDARWPARS